MRQPLAERYDVTLIDLDGVVYAGAHALPEVPECLADLRRRDVGIVFVTNNAARTPADVADHLTTLGVEAIETDVVTSAQAAASLLTPQLPEGAPVLVVGGDGLVQALTDRGLRTVFSATDRPSAVVQGFHPALDWSQLAEGAYAVADGAVWVASNADRSLPTARGVAPGNGALIEVISIATGRTPVVAGKPEPALFREAVHRSGRHRPLVIGDRLETDIAGARASGHPSLLVLTGVTSLRDALLAPAHARPTYLGWNLDRLFESHAVPELGDATNSGDWMVCCAGWTAQVTTAGPDGARHAVLDGDGSAHAALEALATALWAAREPEKVALDAAITVAERARKE